MGIRQKQKLQRPSPNEIADLLTIGIGLLDDDQTWVCLRCGAFLHDPAMHARWHMGAVTSTLDRP